MGKLFSGNIGYLFLGAVVFVNQVQRGLGGAQLCSTENFSHNSDTINFFENMVVAAVTDWSFASHSGTLVNPYIGSTSPPQAAFVQTQADLYTALYTSSNSDGYLHTTGTETVPPPNDFLKQTCDGAEYGFGLAPGLSIDSYPCALPGPCGYCAYHFYLDAMQGLYDYANANPGLFACSGTAGVTSFTTAAAYSSFHTTTGITVLGTLATDYVCVTALKTAIDNFNDCNDPTASTADMRTGVLRVHATCSALDYVGPELFMNMLVAAVVDYMTVGIAPQALTDLGTNLFGATGSLTATTLPSHSTYLRSSGNFGPSTTSGCGLCAYSLYGDMVASLYIANTTTGSYACVAAGKGPADFTANTYNAFTSNAGISAYDLLTDTECMSAVLDNVANFNSCTGSAGTSVDVRTGLPTTRTACVDLDFIGYDFFANLMVAAVVDFQRYCHTNSGCDNHNSGATLLQSDLIGYLYNSGTNSDSLTPAVVYPNPYLTSNLGDTTSGDCGSCAYQFYIDVFDALFVYNGASTGMFVCMQGGPSSTNPMVSAALHGYNDFLTNSKYSSLKDLVVDESCISAIQSAIDAFNTCDGIPTGFDIRTGKKLVRSQCVDLDFVTGQFFKNLLVPAVIDTSDSVTTALSAAALYTALYDPTSGLTLTTDPGVNTFLKYNLQDTTANSCGKCAYSFYSDAVTALVEYTAANSGDYSCANGPDTLSGLYNNFDTNSGVAIEDMPSSYKCIGSLQLAIDNFYNCLRGASGVTATLDVRTGNSTTMCDIPPAVTTQFLDFDLFNHAYTVMMTTAFSASGSGTGTFPATLTAYITGYDGTFPCASCFEQFFQDILDADHPGATLLGSGDLCDASTTDLTPIYSSGCLTAPAMQNALNKLSVCAGTYNILSTSQSFPVSAPVQALWNHAVWGLEAVVVCGTAHDTTTVGGLAAWKSCLTYIGTSPVAGSSNSLVDPTNASELTCFTQLAAAVYADSGSGGAKAECAATASTACITRLNLSTTAPFTSPYLGLSVVPTSSLLSQFQTCSGFALTTTAPTTTCGSTPADRYLSYVPLVVIAIEAIDPATAAKAIFDSADYIAGVGTGNSGCFGCWAKFAAEVNAGFAIRPSDKQACIENPYGTGDNSCHDRTTISTARTRFNTCSGVSLTVESAPTGSVANYTPYFFDNLLGAAVVDWRYSYHSNGDARPGLNNGTQTAVNLKSHIFDATNGLASPSTFLSFSTVGMGLDAASGYGLCAYRFYTDVFNGLDNYNRANSGTFICTASTPFTTQYHYHTWVIGSSQSDHNCIAAIQFAIDNFNNCVSDGFDIRTAQDSNPIGMSTICPADTFAQFEAWYNPYSVIMSAALQITTGSGGTFPPSLTDGFTFVGLVTCSSCYNAFFAAIVAANNSNALHTDCVSSSGGIHDSSCTSNSSVSTALTAFSLCAGTNNIMNTAEAHTVSKPVRDLWNYAIFSLEPIAICSSQYDPLGGTTALGNWKSCLVAVSGGSPTAGASIALVAPTIDNDLFCYKQLGSVINHSPFSTDCGTTAGLATDGTGACYNGLTTRTFGWTSPYSSMSVAPLDSYIDQFYACSGIRMETTSPTNVCPVSGTPSVPVAPYDSYIPILAIALEAADPADASEAIFNSADLGYLIPTYAACYGCWARLAAELNAAFALSASDKAICMANIYGTGANMCGPDNVGSTSPGTTGTASVLNALTNFYACSGYTLAADSSSSDDCDASDYSGSNLYENMMVAAIIDWSVAYNAASARPGMNVAVQTQSDLGTNLYDSGNGLAASASVPLANLHLAGASTPHPLAYLQTGCSLCAYRLYTDVYNALDNYNRATGQFACTTTSANVYSENNYVAWSTAANVGADFLVKNETCVSTVQFAIDNFNNCPGSVTTNDVRTGGLYVASACVDVDFVTSNLFENLLVAAVTDWMHYVYNGGGSPVYGVGGTAASGAALITAMYSIAHAGAGTGLSAVTTPTKNTFLLNNLGSTTATDCGACAFKFYLEAVNALYSYYTQYQAFACIGSAKAPSDFNTALNYTHFETSSGHTPSYWATDDTCVFALQLPVNNFFACQGRTVDIFAGILPYQCVVADYLYSSNPTIMYQNIVLAAVVDFMNNVSTNSGTTSINGGATTSLGGLLSLLYTGSHALDPSTNPPANDYLSSYATTTNHTPRGVNDCAYCAYLFYQNVIKGLYNYQYIFGTYACVGTAAYTDFTGANQYKEFHTITGVPDPQLLAYDRACVSAVQEAIDIFSTCAGAGHVDSAPEDVFDIRTGAGIDQSTCLGTDLVETGFFDNMMVAAVVDFMNSGANSATGGKQAQADLVQQLYNMTANANALTATSFPAHVSYLWHNLDDTSANSCGSCAYNFYVDAIAGLYGYANANTGSTQMFACVAPAIYDATVFSTQWGYSLYSGYAQVYDLKAQASDYVCVGALQLAIDNYYNCVTAGAIPSSYDIRTGNYLTTMCDVVATTPPTTTFLTFDGNYAIYDTLMTAALGTAAFPFTNTDFTSLTCKDCLTNFFNSIRANKNNLISSGNGLCDHTASGGIYATSCLTDPNYVVPAIQAFEICAGTYNEMFVRPRSPVTTKVVKDIWGEIYWSLGPIAYCAANAGGDPISGTYTTTFESCLTDSGTPGSTPYFTVPDNASDFTCILQLASDIYNDNATTVGALTVCAIMATAGEITTCIARLGLESSAFTSPYLGLSVAPKTNMLTEFALCSGFALKPSPVPQCSGVNAFSIPARLNTYIPILSIALAAPSPVDAIEAVLNSADLVAELGDAVCWPCWARLAADMNAGFAATTADRVLCMENMFSASCSSSLTVISSLSSFHDCTGTLTLAPETPSSACVTSDYTTGGSMYENLVIAAVVDWSYAYNNLGSRPGLNTGTQTSSSLTTNLYSGINQITNANTYLSQPNYGNGLIRDTGCGRCTYRFYTDVMYMLDNYRRANPTSFACASSATTYTSAFHYASFDPAPLGAWTLGTQFECVAAIQQAINNFNNCAGPVATVQYDITTGAPTNQCTQQEFLDYEAENTAYTTIMNAVANGVTLPSVTSFVMSPPIAPVPCRNCYTVFWAAVGAYQSTLFTTGSNPPCAGPGGIYSTTCVEQAALVLVIQVFEVCAGTHNHMNTKPVYPVSSAVEALWNRAIWGLAVIVRCAELVIDNTSGDPSTVGLSGWEFCLTYVGGEHVPDSSIALSVPTIPDDIKCFNILATNVYNSAASSVPITAASTDCQWTSALDPTDTCWIDLYYRTPDFTAPYLGWSTIAMNSYLEQFEQCSGFALSETPPTAASCNAPIPSPHDSYIPLLSIALLAIDPAAAAEAVFNSTDLSSGILPTFQDCYGCWARFSAELNAGFKLSPADKSVCLTNMYGTQPGECGSTDTMQNALNSFTDCSGVSLSVGPAVIHSCIAADYNGPNIYLNMVVAAVVDWSNTYYKESPLVSARPGFNHGVQTAADLITTLYSVATGLVTSPTATVPTPNTFLQSHLSDGEGCGLCAYRFYTDIFNSIDNYNRQNPTIFACTTTSGNSYATPNEYHLWFSKTVLLGYSAATVLSDDNCVSILQFAIDNFHSCSGTAPLTDVRTGSDIGPNVALPENFVGTGLFENLIAAAVTDWMHATYNGGAVTLLPTVNGGDAGDGPTLFANLYSDTNVAAGTGLSSLTSPTKISFLYAVLPSSPAIPSALCAYNFYKDVLADLYNYNQAYSGYACVGSGILPSNFATAMDYANFATHAGQPASSFATDDTCIYAIQRAVNNFYICNDGTADIMTGAQPYQCVANDYMVSTDPTNMFQNLMVAAIIDYMKSPGSITGNGITDITTLLANMYLSGTNIYNLSTSPVGNTFLVGYTANTSLTNKGINDCGYCGFLFYKNVIKSLYDYFQRTGSYGCIGSALTTDFQTIPIHDYYSFNYIAFVLTSTNFTDDYACVSAVQPAIDLFMNCAGAGQATVGSARSAYDIRTGLPVLQDNTCSEVDFVETGIFQDVLVAAVVDFMLAYKADSTTTAAAASQSAEDLYISMFVDPTNVNRLTATTNPVHNTFLLYNTANSCSTCVYLFYRGVIMGLHDYAAAHTGSPSASQFACTNGKVATDFTALHGYSLFATVTGVTDLSTFATDYVCVEALQAAINAFHECVAPGVIKTDVRTGHDSTMCDTAILPEPHVFIDLDAQFGIYNTTMSAALEDESLPAPFTTALTGVDCASCITTFYNTIKTNRAELKATNNKPCDENPEGIYASSCTTESTYVVPALRAFELCAGIENKVSLKPRYPVSNDTQAVWNFALWSLEPVIHCGITATEDPAVNADSWKTCLTTFPTSYGGSPALTTPTDPSEMNCFIALASGARAMFSNDCGSTISATCLTDLTTRTQPFTTPYNELSVEVKDSLMDQFYVCAGFKLTTTQPNTECSVSPINPYQSYIPMLSIALQATSPAEAAAGLMRSPDLLTYVSTMPCWPCYAQMAAELNAVFTLSPGDKQICIDNIYGTGVGQCGPTYTQVGGTPTMVSAVSRFLACSVNITPSVETPSTCVAANFGTLTDTYYQNLVVAAVVDWSYAYKTNSSTRPGINAAVKAQSALKSALYDSGHPLTSGTTPHNNDFLSAGSAPNLAITSWCSLCAYRFYVDAVNSLDAYNEAVSGGFACTSSATAYETAGGYDGWFAASSSFDPAELATEYTCVGALQFAINNFNNCAGDSVSGLPIVDIKTGLANKMCAREEFLNFDAKNKVYTEIMYGAFLPAPTFPSSVNITEVTCGSCLTAFYTAIVDGNSGNPPAFWDNANRGTAPCDGTNFDYTPDIYSQGSTRCIDYDTPNGVYLALVDLHVCLGTHNLMNIFPIYPASSKVDALFNHAYWGLEPVIACGARDSVADPLLAGGSPSGQSTWQNCLMATPSGHAPGANADFDVTKFTYNDMYCFNKLASNVYNNLAPAPGTTKADCNVSDPAQIPGSCVFDVSVNTTTAFAGVPTVGLSVTPSDSLLVQFYKCSGFNLSPQNPTGACISVTSLVFQNIVPWVSIAIETTDPASAALEALTRGYISAPADIEGGQACWNCYVRMAAELQTGIANDIGASAACASNSYGEDCLESAPVLAAGASFKACASIPGDASVYGVSIPPFSLQCTTADYHAWQDANIPLMVMYLASTSVSYSSALTSLRSLLTPVRTTAYDTFACQYCFEKLLFDLYTLAHTVPTDIGPCWDNLSLPECQTIAGPIINEFENCSNQSFDYNHSPAGSSTPVCDPSLYPTTNFFDNLMIAAVVDYTKTGDLTGIMPNALTLANKIEHVSTGLDGSTVPVLSSNVIVELVGTASIPTACGACAYHLYTNLVKVFIYHGTVDNACSVSSTHTLYGGGDPNVYSSWSGVVGGPDPLLVFQNITCVAVVQTAIDIFNNCAQNINDVRTGQLSTQCTADQFLEVDATWGVYELFMTAVKNSAPPPIAFVTQVGPLPCGNCILDFYTTLLASRSVIFDVAAACVVNGGGIYSMGGSSVFCIDTSSVTTIVYGAILELERCSGMTNKLYLDKTYHPTLPEQLLFNQVIRSYKPVVECVDTLLSPLPGADPGSTPGTITTAWKTCLASYQQTGSPALAMPDLDMTCFQQFGHNVKIGPTSSANCEVVSAVPNALGESCLSAIGLRDLSLYISPITMPPPRSIFDQFFLCAGFPMNTNVDPITCSEGAVQRDQLGYTAYVVIAQNANDTSNASYSTLTDPILQPLIGSVACFDCFARFAAEMKALPNFATDCSNEFALSCWEAVGIDVVNAPGYNFHVCSGLTIFNDGSGYVCTIEEYNIWQSVSLIQNIMNDVVNALSAEMAVSEYKRLMGEIKTANPDHPFNCDYCFQVLVGTLYTIGITNDLAPCVQDPTSNGCYALPGVSDAYTKFQQCSSMRFNYLPHTITPLDPRTASNTTTTIAPVTTTETPNGGGGGDGTTTTTTLIPFETTTTTAAPPTTEPPTTSSKGAENGSGESLFGYWLLCVGTIIMTLL